MAQCTEVTKEEHVWKPEFAWRIGYSAGATSLSLFLTSVPQLRDEVECASCVPMEEDGASVARKGGTKEA